MNIADDLVKAFNDGYAQGKQDAVPVVRGEWEVAIGYDPNKKVQCQNCYKMAYEPTPYCPNCGCKMEYGFAKAKGIPVKFIGGGD